MFHANVNHFEVDSAFYIQKYGTLPAPPNSTLPAPPNSTLLAPPNSTLK